jgi:hypothetical protein
MKERADELRDVQEPQKGANQEPRAPEYVDPDTLAQGFQSMQEIHCHVLHATLTA